jgi:lysophospholipase L1-like esterase
MHLYRFSLPGLFAALALLSSPAKAQVICTIGDSITAGTDTGGVSWANDLVSNDLPHTYSLNNLAVSSTTLQIGAADGSACEVTSNQTAYNSAIAHDNIFIFMLGTNDAKTANQAGATANFVTDYKAFLNEIYQNGNNPLHPLIYICTPAPALTDSFTIDPNFVNSTGPDAGAGITDMVESLAGYDGAQIINVNAGLSSEFFADPSAYYVGDGIHPSLLGQQAIANFIASDITDPPAVPEPGALSLLFSSCVVLLFWGGWRRYQVPGAKS